MSRDRHRARLAGRVADLLGDARLARDGGDWNELRALASAVLALDPGNREAEALLAGSAERRQMTLMFCDLVGSTAIADSRDPEELGAILRSYRQTCAEVIGRFGGFIEDHQGDGMLVRFGFPEVHEDDARRAVLSALELISAVHERCGPIASEYGAQLHLRVAVHTDLVLLDGGVVTGSAPNEASRLQALAAPDTVVISDATHALVHDDFDVESIGPVALRGVTREVEAFTVLGHRGTRPRAAAARLTPFTGRHAELARIQQLWERVRAGARQSADDSAPSARAVLITGGAGIGKSRLVREAARGLGATCIECRCSGYHEATSLFAFTPVLERACDITELDGPGDRLAKARARLGDEAELPFLAAVLQMPAAATSAPDDVDPSRLRELALLAAARLVLEHVSIEPSLLLVDDLHWADPSSLDLISVLLAAAGSGVVLVLAARDGFVCPWPEVAVKRLALEPLTSPELVELADAMPAATRLPAAERAELISRSDGVPLFLEELVRTADAVERGAVLHRSIAQADFAIPPALRDPLLARLTAPGVDMGLAQLASTIGRDVDCELLRQLSGLSSEVFEARLETLVGAGLIEPSGDGAMRFRHELIRELAYETQRRSARRDRHSAVADRLLARDGASPQRDAGEAAFHLERAHRYAEAIAAHISAAEGDQALGAHIEATTRLTTALGLTDHLPSGDARERAELLVRQMRSFSAVMAGGYAAPEAAEDHARCVELCERSGLAPELVPSLIRSWSYYAFCGRLAEAEHVTETMEHAVREGRLDFPVASVGRGLVAFFRGRFGEARVLMEAFVEHPWGHTDERPQPTWQLPNDPLASVEAHLVPTLWICGERAAADAMAARALERTATLDFPYGPFSAGYVHSLLAMTSHLDGDHEDAARHARAMSALGDRHGFVLWSLAGAIQTGLSAAHAGDHTSLATLVASVATWRHVLVADVWTPYWLTELGAAQRALGRNDDALQSVDEALRVATANGCDFYSSEALRIRGELRRDRGDTGAVADLRAALTKARGQQAPVFELRAAIALAHTSSGTPDASAALAAAIGRFSRDARPNELDEARSLAAL